MKVKRVVMNVCEKCLEGIGEECHVPSCIFCFQDVPVAFPKELYEVISEFEEDDLRLEVNKEWRVRNQNER